MLVMGFALGYAFKAKCMPHPEANPNKKVSLPQSYQRKLQLKAQHTSDSDRIRELNVLSTNQSVFLRLLKQTFSDHDISIKHHRFIVLDRDRLPCAIFEYRDGVQPMKLIDQEDGLPLFLYKGLLSSDELKSDYIKIKSSVKS